MTFREWLNTEASIIDEVIAKSSLSYARSIKYLGDQLLWDIQRTSEESYRLSQGRDLCYDRPTTPLTYALWYQGRRINVFASFIDTNFSQSKSNNVCILDLGAGTGAVAVATGLYYTYCKRIKRDCPRFSLINLDSSPFMLEFCHSHLWPALTTAYPEANDLECFFEVNTWHNASKIKSGEVWLMASYLFDATDEIDVIIDGFNTLVQETDPTKIYLVTSINKGKIIEAIKSTLGGKGFSAQSIADSSLILNGLMPKVNEVRQKLNRKVNSSILGRDATWKDSSISGWQFIKQNPSFFSTGDVLPDLSLYKKGINIRNQVKLSPEQEKACQTSDRSIKLIGPAGSGKSIVITERISRLIKENKTGTLRILVASFNKELIGKLQEWTCQLLGSTARIENKHGIDYKLVRVINSSEFFSEVHFIHIDQLPRFIADIRANYHDVFGWDEHKEIMKSSVAEVLEKFDPKQRHTKALTPEFCLEEYHTLIYGQNIKQKEAYIGAARTGRGNVPRMTQGRKQLMWAILKQYTTTLQNSNKSSLITRRAKLLNKLMKNSLVNNGKIRAQYDHIFLDEFQDCTPADLLIFRLLLKDQKNFFIAGDLAQSVHLGKSSRAIEAMLLRMKNWDQEIVQSKRLRLSGSYRLPVRIAQCISPLSEQIVKSFESTQGVAKIAPAKSAFPGSRPIFVYGESLQELVSKIESIIYAYRIYDIQSACVLERDNQLAYEIRESPSLKGIAVETDSVLKIKGLEKHCVIWSTQAPIPHEAEEKILEYVYTILTRASCLLIIASTPNTLGIYQKVLSLLDEEWLIKWDKASHEWFPNLKSEYKETLDDDAVEDDDKIEGLPDDDNQID